MGVFRVVECCIIGIEFDGLVFMELVRFLDVIGDLEIGVLFLVLFFIVCVIDFFISWF